MAPSGEEPTVECSRPLPADAAAPACLSPKELVARVHEHEPRLRRFLMGMLRDPDLVADALQAATIRALERGASAQVSSFRAWLFQVARNEAFLVHRRAAVRERSYRRLAAMAGSRAVEPPETSLIRGETIDSVRQAINSMPPNLQVIVVARFRDEKTFAQIAAQLEIPLGTVLTRMRRATEILRCQLDPTRNDPP